MADTNRRGLGRGHLDVTALVDALRGISYTGAIVLEVVPTGADATAPDIDDRLPSIIDGYLRESVIALRVHLGQR